MFKPKKRKTEIEEEAEEPEVEEVEEEIEEEAEEPEIKPKQKPQQDTISKQEVADIIEGNLNRSLQLVQYLRA